MNPSYLKKVFQRQIVLVNNYDLHEYPFIFIDLDNEAGIENDFSDVTDTIKENALLNEGKKLLSECTVH